MKKLVIYFLGILMVGLGFVGCTPDVIESLDGAGVPKISEMQITITVDADNMVTFHLDNQGCVPVWILSPNKPITQNDYQVRYKKAGTYSVEVKAYNRNGMSDGSVTKEFVVEKDYVAPINEAAYISKLAGTSSKTWYWDFSSDGHFGCGEPGSNGTNWWKASANEKIDYGMYDDSFTFSSDKSFTFNPGEDGMVYVNFASGYKPDYLVSSGNDYDAPCDVQNTTFTFEQEGENVYLVFPANTVFSYIPNPEALKTPRFRILSITNSKMELVIDNGTIAWYYRLVTEKGTIPVNNPGDEDESGTPMSNLSGGSSKTWVWDYTTAKHFGCGESGSNGTNWWAANANEKVGFGMYDDELTFTSNNGYTFNPGADGLVYVNFASGYKPEFLTTEKTDYDAPCEVLTTTFSLEEEGENTYIVFPANTIVSYIPNPEALANPRYKIIKCTSSVLEMVVDNGSIAWYYRFVPKAK